MHRVLKEAFSSLNGDVETIKGTTFTKIDIAGEAREVATGDILRVTKNPQAQIRVLFSGHMDTVFGADHPFQTETLLDENTLNAPGAADMKGGLLVMLYALRAIERSSLADKIGYEIIINADEEIGSHCSAAILTEAAQRAQFACVYEPALLLTAPWLVNVKAVAIIRSLCEGVPPMRAANTILDEMQLLQRRALHIKSITLVVSAMD